MADKSTQEMVTLTVEMPKSKAFALAQLCKRAGYRDCRDNAVSDDEAYLMISGLHDVREGLERSGVAVR